MAALPFPPPHTGTPHCPPLYISPALYSLRRPLQASMLYTPSPPSLCPPFPSLCPLQASMLYTLVSVLPALASYAPVGSRSRSRSGHHQSTCSTSALHMRAVLASHLGAKFFTLAWGMSWLQILVDYQQV